MPRWKNKDNEVKIKVYNFGHDKYRFFNMFNVFTNLIFLICFRFQNLIRL